MALTLDKIETLAPDQASLAAARKLLKAASWPGLFADSAGQVWGECQGSGSTPYRVAVQTEDLGYKCTCPSRKFPCKHCLALMWMRAEGKTVFAEAAPPEGVTDWMRRRRSGGGRAQDPEIDTEKQATKSMAAALSVDRFAFEALQQFADHLAHHHAGCFLAFFRDGGTQRDQVCHQMDVRLERRGDPESDRDDRG